MNIFRYLWGASEQRPTSPDVNLPPPPSPPSVKGEVFRVTGISPAVKLDDLHRILSSAFGVEGCSIDTSQTTISPSCLKPQARTALIQFTATPGSPRALRSLPNGNVYRIPSAEFGLHINIDKDFYGLTQLYPTTEEIQADIVAVCGLNGHPYGSWATSCDFWNQRQMWLRHFLPADLPECRTMIFGYNSKLTTQSVHTVFDYTQDLLEELEKSRLSEAAKERPIVLVGHSFGGIIIAQAIVKAKENPALYGPLLSSIRTVIFFGTPHRGMIIDDILAMLEPGSPRGNVLDIINVGSKELRNELRRFINYSLELKLKIVSFKETDLTRKLKQHPDGSWSRSGSFFEAVESDSSILQLPSSIEQQFAAEGDHSTMVKFQHQEHNAYTTVVKHVRESIALNTEKDAQAAYNAVENRNASALKRILQRNTTPASQKHNTKNDTLLGIAIANGDIASVSVLLAHNADDGPSGPDGRSPIDMAAIYGHEEITKLLLDHKADLNSRNLNHRTPLHSAAEFGHMRIVKILLENGGKVYIDDRDKYGATPLSLAAYHNRLELVELFLQLGVDPIQPDYRNGITPLDNAKRHRNVKMIKLLKNAESQRG